MGIGTLSLSAFRLACISKEEFSDNEVHALMGRTLVGGEEDVEEFVNILSKYRPELASRLLPSGVAKTFSCLLCGNTTLHPHDCPEFDKR